ncbi:hypothetical protein C8J57DRAFT_1726939 [Mycena rebaudengoi]|nr:hypothetical protein C8J57DRAFT_1726939 [Mycena rebaudengoi]
MTSDSHSQRHAFAKSTFQKPFVPTHTSNSSMHENSLPIQDSTSSSETPPNPEPSDTPSDKPNTPIGDSTLSADSHAGGGSADPDDANMSPLPGSCLDPPETVDSPPAEPVPADVNSSADKQVSPEVLHGKDSLPSPLADLSELSDIDEGGGNSSVSDGDRDSDGEDVKMAYKPPAARSRTKKEPAGSTPTAGAAVVSTHGGGSKAASSGKGKSPTRSRASKAAPAGGGGGAGGYQLQRALYPFIHISSRKVEFEREQITEGSRLKTHPLVVNALRPVSLPFCFVRTRLLVQCLPDWL